MSGAEAVAEGTVSRHGVSYLIRISSNLELSRAP
jgi:hypothetical protein